MKLNLSSKLIGSFSIVLLLMVVVGLVGTYTSQTIRDRLDNIIEQDVKPANILGDVARRAGLIRANSLLHLFTRSIDNMNRYESEVADWIDKINSDLNTLENTFEDQATLDKLAEFRTAWETYLRIWREQVVLLSRANRDEEVFTLARKSGAGGMAAREAMYKLDELHDVNVAAANHRLKLANQDSKKSQYILSAVILLAIILGLAFGIKQSSLVAGAVNTVSKAAQRMATGDLDQRVVIKTGDEIESMADSFNTMAGNMKKMVEELQQEITERERAEEELKKHREHLEELVKERTAELITANKQLQGEITERMQAEEELIKYREHLEELVEQRTNELQIANKELEAFAYSVSHDLRAPLRHIYGFSELLGKRISNALDEKSLKQLHNITEAAKQMGKLIDDLLAFSRIGRAEMNKTGFDFGQIIKKVKEQIEPEIKGREVIWEIGQFPKVHGDPSLLQQVLVNLVSNAVKFTSKRKEARIEIGSQSKEQEYIFYVRDNGVGFDMKYKEKLFKVFQRLHTKDEFEGTGIGLANVQRIIHRHGGRTWAEGILGEGATFYFSLPKNNRRNYE
ncbi:MCP four helix bundle domain-containing protein [bacterium]|nr:MCP four helix bundle domain-containing protein [bacterium]MBU1064814.1 MCP four helix bundle domain-containing protein [bacterium]MBU1635026.1 MCP four helix bundle domain-containing protein [bacterium]MBU1873832.1 MCP four helix bundle domain-containing protein [bacterium]